MVRILPLVLLACGCAEPVDRPAPSLPHAEEVLLERASGTVAEADARPDRPVRVGSILLSLEPSSRVEPVLPDDAAREGVAGLVVLEILIDEQGDVSVRDVLRGHPLLHGAARSAVAQWQYDPVELEGIGVVPVIAVVTVSFAPDELDSHDDAGVEP